MPIICIIINSCYFFQRVVLCPSSCQSVSNTVSELECITYKNNNDNYYTYNMKILSLFKIIIYLN